MCWTCDRDQAMALLGDAERVLAEGHRLRKFGSQMKAQALGDTYRAELRREEDSDTCKEVENAEVS